MPEKKNQRYRADQRHDHCGIAKPVDFHATAGRGDALDGDGSTPNRAAIKYAAPPNK
jgi:hypothetical protein